MKRRRGYLGLPAPSDREMWQTLIDGAHALLSIDSAKQYGLITGGPKINLRRCEQILERGKAMGITPSPSAVENFMRELRSEQQP